MEKFYSKFGLSIAPDIKIRFGQEKSVKGLWKQIIEINDKDKRNRQIDNLIELMELDVDKRDSLEN